MTTPLSRDEAARILEVPTGADARAIKRAYRRLVREHHPDRGGDRATFQRLQGAYERLVSDDVAAPTVARGRPSRASGPASRPAAAADVDSVRWGTDATPREQRLDRDRLAALLVRDTGEPLASVTATSRAPGSRWNGLAPKLSPTFTAWLTIAAAVDDRGNRVVRAQLKANGRRARRALDRAELSGIWSRTRRSTSTTLASTLTPSEDRRADAVRVTDRVGDLLVRLGWPLKEWTTTDEQP